MKSTTAKLALFGGVVALGLTGLLWQRRLQSDLQQQLATLRTENARLATLRDENRTLAAQIAAAERAAAAAPAVVATAAVAPAAATAPAVAKRDDPEQWLVPTGQLKNVGHATPAQAFQTLLWAAVTGDENTLATSLDIGEADRASLEAWHASLDPEARARYTPMEKMPALMLTEEILRKVLAIQIVGTTLEGTDRATVRSRAATPVGKLSTDSFPMQRRDGVWRLALPKGMVDSMRKSLSNQGAASASKPAAPPTPRPAGTTNP